MSAKSKTTPLFSLPKISWKKWNPLQWIRNLLIRQKLLLSFTVIIGGALIFSFYVAADFHGVQGSLIQLNQEYLHLQQFTDLENRKKITIPDPFPSDENLPGEDVFGVRKVLSQLHTLSLLETIPEYTALLRKLEEKESVLRSHIRTKDSSAGKAFFATAAEELEQSLNTLLKILMLKQREKIGDILDHNISLIATNYHSFLSFAILFTIFAILIASYLSSFIVTSLQHISGTTRAIAAGNLDKRVRYTSKDEIGQLATAFNDMTAKLQASYENIEAEVQKKTVALSKKVKEVARKNRTLAEERDKTNAILYSIGDGVFVIDRKYRITLLNQIAAEICGVPVDEAKGKRYDQVLNFRDARSGKKNDAFLRRAIEVGKVEHMPEETVLVRKNGEKVPVADSAAPLKDEEGNILGCVVVFRDITREQELDELKNEFVSIASHQLRAPLGIMRWNLELLLSGDVGNIPPSMRGTVQKVSDSNLRIIGLVNDLLDTSRIDHGKTEHNPEPTDGIAIIQAVLQESEVLAKKKHVTLKLNASGSNFPSILVDAKFFREVIQNLVSNAIKYNTENGVVVVTTEAHGGQVKVKIVDTGIGIPKREQQKMFSKFFRAENARRSEAVGSGLGLYVAKSYVEKWGGKISFESELSKGTTFTLMLPIAKST